MQQKIFPDLAALPSFAALPVHGRRVLLRVDFNDGGTLTEGGQPSAALLHRMHSTLATLQPLLHQGARVAILTHRGRPQGKTMPALSTRALAAPLAELLGQRVDFVPDCIGRIAEQATAQLQPGQVVLLENARFHLGEQLNQLAFAQQLARIADVLINDAFACAHRSQASTGALATLLPLGLGAQFLAELKALQAWHSAKPPRTLLLGGNQVPPKLELIQKLLGSIEMVLVGGVVGHTFLAAKDYDMRNSLVEYGAVDQARNVLAEAGVLGCRMHIPRDVVAADRDDALGEGTVRRLHQIAPTEAACDIGPETLEMWGRALRKSDTLAWLGSVGQGERAAFRKGAVGLAKVVEERQRAAPKSLTLIGGHGLLQALGDEGLLAPLTRAGVFLSTGAGALQQGLSGHPLPAVQSVMLNGHGGA